MTILLVEDDPLVSQFVRSLLKSEGHRVEVETDGLAGLARVAAGRIDLMVLDRVLPDVDGLELCRRVRARPQDLYMPIIVLTGLASESDRHDGFKAGADDYITKPFRGTDLVDRVNAWLRTRRYLHGIQVQQRRQVARDEVLLAEAFATSQDLIRLLTLLLGLMEAAEPSSLSAADLARVRTEMQQAASFLASRINSLTDGHNLLPQSP
jgi:DNA-binding response OmpR family regulator